LDLAAKIATRQLVAFLGSPLSRELMGTDISEVIDRTTRGPRCGLGGLTCVWDFVWQHKNMVAAGVCVAASVGWCMGAVGVAAVGNEYELLLSGAPVEEHAANLIFTVVGLGVGASASEGLKDVALDWWQRTMTRIIVNGPSVTCAVHEEVGSGTCP
jgi:hypothetical protein